MNKKVKIEEILKSVAEILKQNPNLQINYDTIYDMLMNYDLTPEEIKDCNIQYMFSKWEQRFKNSSNLQVYESPLQKGFIQFRSRDGLDKANLIKIYLSFPKETMEVCVNIIFDFIEKNNIKSGSKVARTLRSDSVVLRLINKEDAEKVLNFINSNEFLCQNAKQTSPFSIKAGICGVAYDDRVSYNVCVSEVILQYLNKLKQENKLNSVSYNDFCSFMYSFYQNTFINCSELEKIIDNPTFKKYIDYHDTIEQCVVNLKQVMEIFISNLYSNIDINKYYQLYDSFSNQKNSNSLADKYHNIIMQKNPFLLNYSSINKQKIVEDYIMYGLEKYGADVIRKHINKFKCENNYNIITRDNDFRNKFIAYQITGNFIERNIDVEKILLDAELSKNQTGTNADYEKLLQEYINYSLAAYGETTVINQIEQFIRTTNYNLITRTNGLRDNFINNNIKGSDIDNIVHHDVRGYVQKINEIKNNYQIFCEACFTTYQKYGKEQLVYAISQSFDNNNKGFTNGEKGYREQLSKFLTKENIDYYCEKLLFNLGYDATIPLDRRLAILVGAEIDKYYNSKDEMNLKGAHRM